MISSNVQPQQNRPRQSRYPHPYDEMMYRPQHQGYGQYSPSQMQYSGMRQSMPYDPAPVARDVRNILNLDPTQIPDALAAAGAMNANPPLPHSSHLRNKKTHIVFPWNSILAQQRDLLENCDQFGNTDPAAWMPTVIVQDEQMAEDDLYWRAREEMHRIGENMANVHAAPDPNITEGIPRNALSNVGGVMTWDTFFGTLPDATAPVEPQPEPAAPPVQTVQSAQTVQPTQPKQEPEPDNPFARMFGAY